MDALDSALATYERSLDEGLELHPQSAEWLFQWSEEYPDLAPRIDALLARQQALVEQPLDEVEQRIYDQQVTISRGLLPEQQLRNIARGAARELAARAAQAEAG